MRFDQSFLSFTPVFSPVTERRIEEQNRFNGFLFRLKWVAVKDLGLQTVQRLTSLRSTAITG
jgi:hypothetical protein